MSKIIHFKIRLINKHVFAVTKAFFILLKSSLKCKIIHFKISLINRVTFQRQMELLSYGTGGQDLENGRVSWHLARDLAEDIAITKDILAKTRIFSLI